MEYADDLAFDEYMEDNDLDKNATYTYEDIKDAFLSGFNRGLESAKTFGF